MGKPTVGYKLFGKKALDALSRNNISLKNMYMCSDPYSYTVNLTRLRNNNTFYSPVHKESGFLFIPVGIVSLKDRFNDGRNIISKMLIALTQAGAVVYIPICRASKIIPIMTKKLAGKLPKVE